MGLSRRYLLALVVTVIGVAAFVAVPKITSAIHDREARDALVAADAVFNHLKVPHDFVALEPSHQECQWYPCYRVARRFASIEPQLPAILRSTGAKLQGTLHQQCRAAPFPLDTNYCALYGLSHGYQVLLIAEAQLSSCVFKPHRIRLCPDSIVEILAPYIPDSEQPDNGGSGWPLSS